MKNYNTFEDMIADMVLIPSTCKVCHGDAGGTYVFKDDLPSWEGVDNITYCSECLEDAMNGFDDPGDGLTDAEADAMTLASAGMGTDEDYGYYGDCGEDY